MRRSLPFELLATIITSTAISLSSPVEAAPQFSAILLPQVIDYRDLNDRGDVLMQVIHHEEVWGFVVSPAIYSAGRTDVLPPIGDNASPHAINNRREIVGFFSTVDRPVEHAFMWSGGQYRQVAEPLSVLRDINDSGVAVGMSWIPGLPFWSLVIPEDPEVEGDLGDFRAPLAINEAGHMAGMMTDDPQLPTRAFLYADGELTDLGTLAGPEGHSVALALNDRDEVTGFSSTDLEGRSSHAFLFSQEALTDIGVLEGDSFSEGLDINNAGDVVGLSVGAQDDLPTAFLYSQATLYDLNTLVVDLPDNARLAKAVAINARGEILAKECEGTDPGCRAFLLTPLAQAVPEPALPALLVIGFSALLVTSSARRREQRHEARRLSLS